MQGLEGKIAQNQHPQNDAVHAEYRKAVLAYIFHQTLDDKQADHVGMARKKENSAPAALPTPRMIAPRMVEPEREVPGIRLRHWKQPMSKAVFKSISYTEFA